MSADATPRIWTCAVCGKSEAWSDDWSWFGSWLDYEETGEPMFVTCSDTCRATPKATRLVARCEAKPKPPRRHASTRAPSYRQQLKDRITELERELKELDS